MMISKTQYRKLRRMINEGKTVQVAADKAGMDVKTAKKYLEVEDPFMPTKKDWQRRADPFKEYWSEIEEFLKQDVRLEAKTAFCYLCQKYPNTFSEGQLRTLQRKFKTWKALYGESKEIFFPQTHYPADLCQSDFTHMDSLNITIQRIPFSHMLYHFVLTYSNWESVTLCYSENLESLMEGLQNALWQLGGVPKRHRSDRLTAAVKNLGDNATFTARYQELMDWYGLSAEKSQAGCPNENGDVEQGHHRFKRGLEQALILRGSRDFNTIDEYRTFLQSLVLERNRSRSNRFMEEDKLLKPLPETRMVDFSEMKVKVSRSSTIQVKGNTYSVPCSLIGENVVIKIKGSALEVFYADRLVEQLPRLQGRQKSQINYRHIIGWLVRKPGAFENYRYRQDLYPSTIFRTTYDQLKQNHPNSHVKQYLAILYAALSDGEQRVESVLRQLLAIDQLSAEKVKELLAAPEKIVKVTDIIVPAVDLALYDQLLIRGDAV